MKYIRLTTAALFTALSLLCAPAISMAEETQAAEAQKGEVQKVAAVNINSASAVELAEKLDGIGESKAALIVQFRDEQGPFSSAEQLLEVKGVGQATLDKNRDRIEL